MKCLDVFFFDRHVGELSQKTTGKLTFQYSEEYLKSEMPEPISHSLPLRADEFSEVECLGFFGGILPEEAPRATIARILGVSEQNDFALLRELGGETIGGITLVMTGEGLETVGRYKKLSQDEWTKIVTDLPSRPLMAGSDGVRLSLAGAQVKLSVWTDGDKHAIPLGSAPSTHLVKPESRQIPELVENEAFSMRLAAAVGLDVARVSVGVAAETRYLLVQRYDRAFTDSGSIRRLHQEDFCQALGIPAKIKYQNEGGPSLTQAYALVRRASSQVARDVLILTDAVIFNFLIGNHDAHGKNFSLLEIDGTIAPRKYRLAPLYDLVSTGVVDGVSRKLAMKIGNQYDSEKVFKHHWEDFARDTMQNPTLVCKRVLQVARLVESALETSACSSRIHEAIREFAMNRIKITRTRFAMAER